MGMFSYNCKECGHPLLSGHATDAGINEWMSEAVVLTPRGSRFIGTYDGYGRAGGCEDLDGAACLHEACWEEAGRPEWGRYGSVSDHAADQGFFFDDGAHDMIDPRIKEGRDELLAAGVAARTERRHDERARRVREWVRDEPMDDRPRWRQRFRYGPLYEDGKPIDGRWYISDDLGTSDRHDFPGTEAEVAAECARLWDEFTSGEECAALLARAEKLREESRRAHLRELAASGRYEVSYGPSRVGGDSVSGRKTSRQRFYVRDKLTYEEVASFDYQGDPADFGDPADGYGGNHSPEWEARVDENRADAARRRAMADAEAARLNAEWAAAGHPDA